MNYITVAQLSERWMVTQRYIQNLCRDGRLDGAIRMGKMWMLPENIARPADNRYKGNPAKERLSTSTESICLSTLIADYHIPGTEYELVRSLDDKPERLALVKAQFAYMHGDLKTCAELSNGLLNSSNGFEIKIGSAFLAGICALYSGDVVGWKRARTLIEKMPCPDNSYTVRKELWLAVYGATIYDLSAYPKWFRRGCFDLLPNDYYPIARVHYIKYIYMYGDEMVKNQPLDGKVFNSRLFLLAAICEPLISQTAMEKEIISEIYLRLFCASTYHHAGNDRLAAEHIDRALALALPDRIYAPFAEQKGTLDSLIDDRLRLVSEEALYRVRALSAKLMAGWSAVHNTVLGRSYSTELTAKELEAARLAVFGLSNNEIAARMCISVNSVKTYLQSAKEKTGASKRSELARFI